MRSRASRTGSAIAWVASEQQRLKSQMEAALPAGSGRVALAGPCLAPSDDDGVQLTEVYVDLCGRRFVAVRDDSLSWQHAPRFPIDNRREYPSLALARSLAVFVPERPSSHDAWALLTVTLAVHAVADEIESRSGSGDLDARYCLPIARRAAFLVFSAWFRDGAPSATDAPAGEVAFHARRARDRWIGVLVSPGRHPLLAFVDQPTIDSDVAQIAFDGRRPLSLQSGALGNPVEQRARQHVTQRLLLPRYRVIDTVRLGGMKVFSPLWALLVTLAAAAAVGSVVVWRPDVQLLSNAWLLGPGAVAFLWWALTVFVQGPLAAMAALLRIPAGVVVGQAVVLSMPQAWLGQATLPASLGLLLASGSYLWFESVQHGAPRGRAVLRAMVVLALGASYAALITSATFAVLLGSLVADTGAVQPSGRAWLFAVSLSLAMGTFLQMLWEEHAVTAPLSRVGGLDVEGFA